MEPVYLISPFVIFWVLAFFVVLPLGLTTQGEDGKVLRGTASSAPARAGLGPKLLVSAVIAVILWSALYGAHFSGVIDLPWGSRPAAPAAATDGTGG